MGAAGEEGGEMPDTVELDATKMEAIGAKLLDILNGGMAANMISLGHRTGLFDAMAELPGAATSSEVAQAANGESTLGAAPVPFELEPLPVCPPVAEGVLPPVPVWTPVSGSSFWLSQAAKPSPQTHSAKM